MQVEAVVPAESANFQILYKGKIFGICDVLLFTQENRPDIISYEIADRLSSFKKGTWISNFKPVYFTGDFCIKRYKTISSHIVNSETLVADLLKLLEEDYAQRSAVNYVAEITHGTH